MGAARQRKLDARARRQESLRNQGIISTEIKHEVSKELPIPTDLKVKEKVLVKSPKITEIAKRGRGRPKKVVSELISTKKGKTTSKGKK